MLGILQKGNEEMLAKCTDVIDANLGTLDTSIVQFITNVAADGRKANVWQEEHLAFLITYVLLDVFGSQEALYNTLYNDEQWQRWSRYDEYWKLGLMRVEVERILSYPIRYSEPDDFPCSFDRHMPTDADYISIAANKTIIQDKALIECWVQKHTLTPEQLKMYAPIPAKKADGGVKLPDNYKTWRTVTFDENSKTYTPSRTSPNQTIDSSTIKSGLIWVPVNRINSSGAITFILPKNIVEKYHLPIKE